MVGLETSLAIGLRLCGTCPLHRYGYWDQTVFYNRNKGKHNRTVAEIDLNHGLTFNPANILRNYIIFKKTFSFKQRIIYIGVLKSNRMFDFGKTVYKLAKLIQECTVEQFWDISYQAIFYLSFIRNHHNFNYFFSLIRFHRDTFPFPFWHLKTWIFKWICFFYKYSSRSYSRILWGKKNLIRLKEICFLFPFLATYELVLVIIGFNKTLS